MENKNLTSLILTGDLQGMKYIKKTVSELPTSTFNFCCTIDAFEQKKEADLTLHKPVKNS